MSSKSNKKSFLALRDLLYENQVEANKPKSKSKSKSKSKTKSKPKVRETSKSKSKTNEQTDASTSKALSKEHELEIEKQEKERNSIKIKISQIEDIIDAEIWNYFIFQNKFFNLYKIPIDVLSSIEQLSLIKDISFNSSLNNLLTSYKINLDYNNLVLESPIIEKANNFHIKISYKLFVLLTWLLVDSIESKIKILNFELFLSLIDKFCCFMTDNDLLLFFEWLSYFFNKLKDLSMGKSISCKYFSDKDITCKIFEVYNDLPKQIQRVLKSYSFEKQQKEIDKSIISLPTFEDKENVKAKIILDDYKSNGNLAILEPLEQPMSKNKSKDKKESKRKSIIVTHLNKITDGRKSLKEDVREIEQLYKDSDICYYPYNDELIKQIKENKN